MVKTNLHLKLIICIFCAFLFAVLNMQISHAQENQEYTIYSMNSKYESKISIPNNIPKSVQLEGFSSNATYSVSGGTVTVSKTGLIKPVIETWYWKNGRGSTSPIDGYDRIEKTPKFGDSTITVRDGNNVTTVTVENRNYANYYATNKLRKYVDTYVMNEPSDRNKLDIITEYPAQFPYNANYQSYTDMIIFGGGDCWASANTIKKLCEMAGIPAHIRYAASDPGAGSGHRNCAAEVDDEIYVCDAGYAGTTTPRKWTVKKLTDGFSYTVKDGKATIYQYDGNKQNLTIPGTIDGYPVTTVGSGKPGFNSSDVDFESITLEEGISNIKGSAFNSLTTVERIHLPSTIENIETLAFVNCKNLNTITVEPGSAYTVQNGNILFTSDMKSLVWFPCVYSKSEYTIPRSVETIKDYAFYYSNNITKLNIPDSVKTIGEAAIPKDCKISKIEFFGDKPVLNNYAFYKLTATIYYPKDNLTWKNASSTLGSATKLTYVAVNKKNGPIMTDNGPIFYENDKPLETVGLLLYKNNYYYVKGHGILVTGVYDVHQTNGLLPEGTYTFDNKGRMIEPNGQFEMKISKNSFTYSGKAIKPTVTVTLNGNPVPFDVKYERNTNAGTAKVTAYNIQLAGDKTLSKEFTINPKEITPTVKLSKNAFAYNGKNQYPAISVYHNNIKLTASDYSVVKTKSSRVPGPYKVKAVLKGNYRGTASAKYKINPKGTTLKKLVAGKKALTVKFKKQTAQITGYQIKYAKNSKFKKTKLIKVSKKKASVKIRKLKSKTRYYVKIRTYKKVGSKTFYSTWSKTKSVKVK